MPGAREQYSFGRWTVDVSERMLLRDGEPVAIRDKVFAALECFIRNPGKLLSKEELLETIWPDAHVSEANLNQAISELRRILGDSDLIQTVPKRGFRFIAPKKTRRVGRVAVPLAAVALLVAVVVSPLGSHRSETASTVRSVSVLPFRLLGGSAADAYIATSLSETLSTRLAAIPRLMVRTAANDSADAIIKGTVQPLGDRIRITAQVIDSRRNAITWSRSLECHTADLPIIEDALAKDIANDVRPELTEEQRARLTPPRSADAIANQEYLTGRDLLDRRHQLDQSVAHFERAVARDPNFALAWAGLAEALAVPWGIPGSSNVQRAETAARRAIHLDASLPEGHAVLGMIDLFYTWDFAAADRELRLALQLKPGSARLHDWYSLVLMARGDMQRAVREVERAHEIDPLAGDIASDVALMHYEARDYAAAEATARTAMAADEPTNAASYLVNALVMQHRTADAVAAIATLQNEDADAREIARLVALATSGDGAARERALEIVRHRDPTASPDARASVFALLGANDEAIAWLERGYRAHAFGLIFIGVAPEYDHLRGDPRFRDVLRRVGVVEPPHQGRSTT